MENQRKKVGLALGGGFIRAASEIGVIEVLEENGIKIDMVSGCSSGAAIAGAYANGKLNKIKRSLIDGSRREFMEVIIEPTFPREGILKGERNKKWFEEFVEDKNIEDMNIPLFLTATDIKTMKPVILDKGPAGLAIQGCTAVPGIFVPVKTDTWYLVDGGNFNIIPTQVLYDNGADYVIGVYISKTPNIITRTVNAFLKLRKREEAFCQIKGDCNKRLNIFHLSWRTMKMSFAYADKFYHHSYNYDILIKPEMDGVKRWHTNSAGYCYLQGRKAAERVVAKIKSDLNL